MTMIGADPGTVLEGLAREDGFALQVALARVSDLMSREVVTLAARRPLAEAVAVFEGREVDHLIVTEGQRLVGTLTRCGALCAMLHADDALTRPAGNFADRNPATIRPHASLSEAIHLLVTRRPPCLPVTTEDLTVRGVLTAPDLLRAFFAVQRWLETRAPRLDG